MKYLAIITLAFVLPALAGPVDPDRVRYALTPIDTQPTTQQLNLVHNNSEQEALDNLRVIALAQTGVDPGVQLRAVRALVQYCKDPCSAHLAHQTLLDVESLPRYRNARAGTDLLMLRAAIESIGVLRVPEDMAILLPYLNHPSRDIRVATAYALRDLGNTQAIDHLRMRYNEEIEPNGVRQVAHALSDALRVLGGI